MTAQELKSSEKKVWLYIWVAGRNHDSKNPSYFNYHLLDEESEILSNEEDMKWFIEKWGNDVLAAAERYQYGFVKDKVPPREWIEKKIKNIDENISGLNKYKNDLLNYLPDRN